MVSAKCVAPGRLDGKLAVVTGANTGIGLETTAELARRGARVIMACRNAERADAAKDTILQFYGADQPTALTRNVATDSIKEYLKPVKPEQLQTEILDLASFASIREFAQRICTEDTKIDFLINNAGVMACPYTTTSEGFESQMGTNHIGHFLLTDLLLPAVKRAGTGARIICLSSIAHKKTKVPITNINISESEYSPWYGYSRSKLANVLFAESLADRLKSDGIIVASVHPGVVATELYKGGSAKLFLRVMKPFMKNPWQGAQTTLHAVLANDIVSGGYYASCRLASTNPLAKDKEQAENLWRLTEEAISSASARP